MTCGTRATVLYISYDGVLEPLGHSQVVSYLTRLASRFRVVLLSFEKQRDWREATRRDAMARHLTRVGILWRPLRYHRSPSAPATAWDISHGLVVGLRLALRHNVRIIHARSYVAAAMALPLAAATGARFLFDMRGFWADERVDGGLWTRDGLLHRVAKLCERQFLLNADHVISLTHAAVRHMERFPYLDGGIPPTTVIPTCVDLDRFQAVRTSRSSSALVFGYVGSAGTWYNFDAAAQCFAEVLRLRPGSKLLVLNRHEHHIIHGALAAHAIPDNAVDVCSAAYVEVPAFMSRMDAGMFFIKPLFSKQASAPTKLAEFLACGLPCLTNDGVGDMADVLRQDNVGIAVPDLSPGSLRNGVAGLLDLLTSPGVSQRCRSAAFRHFSLEEGVRRYASVYDQLIAHA